ncbi:MAG TPA: delta-60 repeat domain-containing protein [Solirubrobacterales bacterium]
MASGQRDLSFGGSDGFAVAFEGSGLIGQSAMAVDSMGRVLVVQASSSYESEGMVVARLDTEGRLDSSFGTGGKVSFACVCVYEFPNLMIDGQGRIVVMSPGNEMIPRVGSYPPEFEFGPYSISLFRLLPSGARDTSFGNGGSTSIKGFDTRSGALRKNGSIVMTAFRRGKGSFVVRVSANGRAVDRQFNASKRLRGRKLGGVLALPKNRVAILGSQEGGSQSILLRLGGDGSLDSSFRGDGIAKLSFSVSTFDADRRGRILISGTTAERGLGGPAEGWGVLRRLLPNGKRDMRFLNGLGDRDVSSELSVQAFYNGDRPMVFQDSTFVDECRAYCRPDPTLSRFLG